MTNEERIAEILGEWYLSREQGEAPSPEEVIEAHPDLREELAAHFDVCQVLEAAFPEPVSTEIGAPRVIGDFRLLREIGKGGMGAVFEAEQVSMGRRVALKILSPSVTSARQAVQRFQREAKAAGWLHHTNIVPIYAMGEDRGFWYYAMELVEGPCLAEVIAWLGDGEEVPLEAGPTERAYYTKAAEMFAGVAEALQATHDERIIHRDIKPSNLLLAEDGTLKLVDFGLAHLEGDTASVTLSGQLLGTPHYMSPEQAAVKRVTIDHRTDIYSLGATLYEFLTLSPPFKGDSLQEVFSQIATKEPVLPRKANPKIPRDLETILLKAMEKDRKRRYQSAGELAKDLQRFVHGLPIGARRTGPVGRAWKRVKRHKARSMLAAALVLLAVAGGVLALYARRQVDERRELEYRQLCLSAEEAMARSMSRVVESEFQESMDIGESARDLFTRAIALAPDRMEAYFGRALAPGQTIQQRLVDLDAAHDRGLPAGTWHRSRAHFHQLAGSRDKAAEESTLATRYSMDSAADGYFGARLLSKPDERAAAIGLLTQAIQGSEHGSLVQYLALRHRAFLRVAEGQLAGALEDLNALRRMGDDRISVGIGIASLWHRLGREDEAEERFQRVLEKVRDGDRARDWGQLHNACTSIAPATWTDEVNKAALEAHDRAIARDPDDASAREMQGIALGRLGQNQEALAAIDQAIDLDPGRGSAHFCRGVALGFLGRHKESLASFGRACELDPNNATWCGARSGAFYKLGLYEEALATIDKAVALDNQIAQEHNNRGCILAKLGRRQEALASYERSLDLDPNDAGSHFNRGETLHKLGKLRDALEAYDKAIEIDPGLLLAHISRGNTLQGLGQHEAAMATFERGLKLGAHSAAEHSSQGLALSELGRYQEALASYERSLALDLDNAVTHRNRGIALGKLGRLVEALAAHDRAIDLEPDDARAHSSRGNTLRKLGRLEEALAAGDKAIDLDPDDAVAHANRSASLDDLGRHEEALVATGRAIELDPDCAIAHFNRGVVLTALGRVEEALAAYDRAIELDPDDANAHFNRGVVLGRLGRFEQALAAYDRAIEIDSEYAFAHANRGASLGDLGRHDEALVAIERALKIDPRNARMHRNHAIVLRTLERFDEAIAACDRAISIDPNVASAHANRGALLWQRPQRRQDALESFDRALAIDDRLWGVWAIKGALLRELMRYADAVDAYERSLALRTTPVGLGGLAGVLATCPDVSVRDPERAVKLARNAVAMDPDAGWIRNTLGVAHYYAGNFEESLKALEKSMELGSGGSACDWFFVAMAKNRLDHDDAREWYAKAVVWMEEHKPDDEDLKRFRAEAEEVLGIAARPAEEAGHDQ